MRDFDIFGEESMYESEDLFDLENVYRLPIEMIIYFKDRAEPMFAEHVFFFEKEDPVKNLDDLMSFTSSWWDAISDDKNIKFLYLTDKDLNKKAILLENVIAVSFMTPEKPEWMEDGKDATDPS